VAYTSDYPIINVTVDAVVLIIDGGELQALMVRRGGPPYQGRWALPGGFLEVDEDLEAAARRELLEETGYAAAEWRRLGVIHTAIAYTDESIELFIARKLTLRERALDDGEFLELLIVDFGEAIRMIRDGRITDAKTVAALLLTEKSA